MKYKTQNSLLSANSLLLATICMASLVLTGCGSDGPSTGQVTGVVTYDGKPLEKATVAFHPTEGRGSIGVTDAEGKYKLLFTRDRDGATLGVHKVTIKSEVFADTDRNLEYDDTGRGEIAKGRKEFLPEKYRLKQKTVLTAEVKSGSNEFNFDLEKE